MPRFSRTRRKLCCVLLVVLFDELIASFHIVGDFVHNMLRMEEMRCLSDDYDMDLDQVDLKGCIRGGARRTVAYTG